MSIRAVAERVSVSPMTGSRILKGHAKMEQNCGKVAILTSIRQMNA
jgi:DNA-binding LacI/PurR family transcriptional regulator